MKITVSQLRKIIQEEVQTVNESGGNLRIVNQYYEVVKGIEARVNDVQEILKAYERFKAKNYYLLIGSDEQESTEGKQEIRGMIGEMESLMRKINNLSGMLSNLEAPFNQLKADLESQLNSNTTPEPKPKLTQAQKRAAILKGMKSAQKRAAILQGMKS